MSSENWYSNVGISLAALALAIGSLYFRWKKSKPTLLKTLENPDQKYPLKLIKKEEISHDTR